MKRTHFFSLAAYVAMALCGTTAFLATSCNDDDDNSGARLTLSASKLTLAVGGSSDVSISGGTAPYTAICSDTKIITANASKNTVKITGVKAGKGYVLVKSRDNATGRIAVTVTESALSFDKSAVETAVDKEASVTVKDGTAPFSVTVKDTKVASATVKDAVITIKGLSAGTTTVTVTDKAKRTGTLNVTVK